MLLRRVYFTWSISLFYPVFRYREPPKVEEVKISSVKIGAVDDMGKDSGKIIKFENKSVILIIKIEGEYIVFTVMSTYLDYIVQFKKKYRQIYFTCHNGRNVSEPLSAPLNKFGVTIKNDEMIICGEEALS